MLDDPRRLSTVRDLVQSRVAFDAVAVSVRSGADHLSFVLERPEGRLVLRCPKEDLPGWRSEQHAVASWLGAHGISTPEIIDSGDPGDGLPVPWTILEYGGEPLNTISATTDERRRLDDEAGELLAAIHRIGFSGPGFVDLRTDSFEPCDHYRELERQGRTALAWIGEHYGSEIPGLELAGRLLDRIAPTEEAVLCHGDFTPDNFLVRAGRIRYIVDWSPRLIVTDPLSDLIRWEMVRRLWGGCIDVPLTGYFSRSDRLERYRAIRPGMLVQHLLICMHRFRHRHGKAVIMRFLALLGRLTREFASG